MQPSDDLDDLIRELNASTALGEATPTLDTPADDPAASSGAFASAVTDDAEASLRDSATAGAVASAAKGDTSRLERWLSLLRDRGASDLLLVSGAPPVMRLDGRVVPLGETPLDSHDIQRAVVPALPPHAQRAYRDAHIADSSFRVRNIGRFRINGTEGARWERRLSDNRMVLAKTDKGGFAILSGM